MKYQEWHAAHALDQAIGISLGACAILIGACPKRLDALPPIREFVEQTARIGAVQGVSRSIDGRCHKRKDSLLKGL